MAITNVEIIPGLDHITVRWRKSEDPETVAGIVSVTSMRKAEKLKAQLEEGVAPAYAIRAALAPPKRIKQPWKAEYGSMGGKARMAALSARKRKELGKLAAAARWGKKEAK